MGLIGQAERNGGSDAELNVSGRPPNLLRNRQGGFPRPAGRRRLPPAANTLGSTRGAKTPMLYQDVYIPYGELAGRDASSLS